MGKSSGKIQDTHQHKAEKSQDTHQSAFRVL